MTKNRSELNPAVQAYLDEHLLRSISHKNSLAGMRGGSLRPRNLRRRMSVKGAIKKTRSINVDCKYLSSPLLEHIHNISHKKQQHFLLTLPNTYPNYSLITQMLKTIFNSLSLYFPSRPFSVLLISLLIITN